MKKFIVLAAALAMVFAFSVPAMADVSLYGSARMMTYSTTIDNTGAAFDDTDTEFKLGTLTRMGAKFTAGDVTGLWEMDARAGSHNASSHLGDMRIRHAFGEWNFGSGKLLVGQTWPVVNFFISHLNYTAAGMMFDGGVGTVYARAAQIRFTFGDFKIGLLAPSLQTANLWGITYANPAAAKPTATDNGERDVTFPKIELRYDLKLDTMKFAVAAGYQTYEDVNSTTDYGVDIDSYVLGVAGWFNFGPAYLNVGLHYAQNPGNYDLGDRYRLTYSAAYFNPAGTDVNDMTGWGGLAVLGYKVSDMVTLEAGYGMLDYSGDNGTTVGGPDREDTNQSYYIQAKITLAPGVYMVPEIMVFDKDEYKTDAGATVEEATQTTFGIWWCINFK